MNIGILGTGAVGQTIGSKLISLGHQVKLGGRSASNDKAQAWVKTAGPKASAGTFADAAAFGELLFVCTAGSGTLDALKSCPPASFDDKVLIDITNPLDFSKGMPPTLSVSNTDSLGEQVQRALPKAKVVKTLNTINCKVMVEPSRVAGGDHDVLMSGNDAQAKARVAEVLRGWFGWQRVTDLGDITTARGTEAYLLLWVRLWGALGTADFNVKLVR